MPDPFSAWVGQNLTASAALSDIEPAGQATGQKPTFSTATVAGQASQCLSYGSAVTALSMCVTDSGLLARLQASLGATSGTGTPGAGGMSSAITLTTYAASAPASDFAPPAGVPIRAAGSSPAATAAGQPGVG
jgi:hypothetical protein